MAKKETPRWVSNAAIIFLILIVCVSMGMSVRDIIAKPTAELFSGELPKGSCAAGTISYSTGEFYRVRHSVNGLIPLGSEHFFIAFDRNEEHYVVVRAKEDFADTLPSGGVDTEIEGKVTTLPAGAGSAVSEVLEKLNKSELGGTYVYVDTLAKRDGIKNATGLLMAVLGIVFLMLIAKGRIYIAEGGFKKAVSIVTAIVIIIGMLAVILVI